MATDVHAIATSYGGCRFRSRLEARWAVFFDRTGTEWSYEPQGYVVDGYCYLPDFWLPGLGSYFEVKGLWDDSVRKPLAFGAALEGRGLYLAMGDIPRAEMLSLAGWASESGGVRALTDECFPWSAWFPPDGERVQVACEAARSERFDRERVAKPATIKAAA